jgi:hypothetical protein
MDSAQVFFIDSSYGPEIQDMERKNKDGTVTAYGVPKAIGEYNDNMNGVDAWDEVRNGRYSFVMKHSSKKYTIRIFCGIDEMAQTNAYNIHRYHHSEKGAAIHGFHLTFQCDLVREIMDYVESKRRNRSAVNLPGNQLGGGHTLMKVDDWVGDGKTKRRKRSDCAFCPYTDEFGNRVHRQVVTYCPICNVALHDTCFAAYHASNGFQLVNQLGAIPATGHSGGRSRNRFK